MQTTACCTDTVSVLGGYWTGVQCADLLRPGPAWCNAL